MLSNASNQIASNIGPIYGMPNSQQFDKPILSTINLVYQLININPVYLPEHFLSAKNHSFLKQTYFIEQINTLYQRLHSQ